MPLSINKLEKILSKKGLLPKKYFIMHGLCVYIEVLSISNADSFMLYIPSKYEIVIPETNNNVYKIRYIDVSQDGNVTGDYAGEPDNFELEKEYDEVDMDFSTDNFRGEDMAEYLEEHYKHSVSLKDNTKDDTKHLREIFRQLHRLRFCVQSISYKLCILF